MNSKQVHEKYHKKTKPQNKVISKNNFTYKIILPVLDKYINSTNQKILDIGCGSGTLSLYLASKGNMVHGIDISKKAIDASKKSAKELRLNNALFEVSEFPKERLSSKKYDVILLLEVIEHVKDDAKVLKSIYSKLNKHGILILSTPSINAPLYRLGMLHNFDMKVGHLRRYDYESIRKKINDADFKIIEVKRNEGIIRNLLFTNSIAGNSVRFIRSFLVEPVTFLDNIALKLFGESDYIIIARKE